MRSTQHIDKLNKGKVIEREAYMKQIDKLKGPKRWCARHRPTATWGINPATGEYYKRCMDGNRLVQDCIIGETDE